MHMTYISCFGSIYPLVGIYFMFDSILSSMQQDSLTGRIISLFRFVFPVVLLDETAMSRNAFTRTLSLKLEVINEKASNFYYLQIKKHKCWLGTTTILKFKITCSNPLDSNKSSFHATLLSMPQSFPFMELISNPHSLGINPYKLYCVMTFILTPINLSSFTFMGLLTNPLS